MAEKIPLNFYKRITKPLKRVPETVYKAPLNKASTIISTLGTNTTDKDRFITLSLSSADTDQSFVAFSNIPLEPRDYINVIPSKIVLGENDEIVASADIEDLATINDPGLFWLYDLPTDVTEVSLQLDIAPPAEVTVNWGESDFRNSATNENFDDWSAPEIGPLPISAGFIDINTGALNWAQGLSIQSTNSPVGTVKVTRMNTTSAELQYFNTTYYARTTLSGVNFGSTLLWQFTGDGNGFICTQNDLDIKSIEPYLGKQVNVTFWARASQPTKIFSETQIHSTQPLWTPTQWKIFDIGTTWQQYQHVYTNPTYEEVARAGYNPNLIDVNNPQYIPLSASNSLPPLSTWLAQVDIKTLWSLGSHIRHGNHPNRPPFPGTAMSVAELSSVISNAVTNGYYDVAAVRFTLGDGTNNFTTELSSGSQSASFVYDPTLDTDTNLTLSILESVNTQ